MSMRSATNKRTLEHEYTGATRKGASSAKPARAAAGSVRVVPASAKARRKAAERGENLEGLSKEEKRARKREERAREDRLYDASSVLLKADEDYNKYRKIFWAILGVGMAAIVVTWYVLLGGQQDHVGQSGNPLEIVGIVVSYAAIIGAFVFDMVKIRPIRNYCRSKAEGMSERKIAEVLAAASSKGSKGSGKDAAEVAEGSANTTVESAKKPKKNQRSRR